MINVMLDPLPEEWNGYKVNTSFRIGIQVFLVQYDKELNEYEKSDALIYLLFDEREHPDGDELRQCVEWFLNGWFHDKPGSAKDNRRLVDYDVDQWRIYADFRQIYGIDLSLDDMHWWMFKVCSGICLINSIIPTGHRDSQEENHIQDGKRRETGD